MEHTQEFQQNNLSLDVSDLPLPIQHLARPLTNKTIYKSHREYKRKVLKKYWKEIKKNFKKINQDVCFFLIIIIIIYFSFLFDQKIV